MNPGEAVVEHSGNRWVLGARPKTLPAAVVPVAVGTAAAVGEGEPIFLWRAFAAAIVALGLQVATNYVNDFADAERGADENRVGPVRLVASGLATVDEVKAAAVLAFIVASAAGIALSIAVGPELLIVGIVSIIAGWGYTGGPKPYGYMGLGEVFVFVFFGIVATAGSTYVQLSRITPLSVICSIAVGFLAVALLVVNNLRDRPFDAEAGKRTLAVRLGDAKTRQFYIALIAGTAACVVAAALLRWPAVIGLAGLVSAARPVRAILDGFSDESLIPVLEDTGRAQFITGTALALGLVVGGMG
ncbi:MAG: 1,4-dihydroxy-2-naphthoate polyprenyltransferase [Acidimicrobiia bacterium]|nr:1,4-dihydroxy-2-naphthoate polyprenyltransferase [Acidimicrobiia bacterium]